jgi:hypothetical protein
MYRCQQLLGYYLPLAVYQIFGYYIALPAKELEWIIGDGCYFVQGILGKAYIGPFYLAEVGGTHANGFGQLQLTEASCFSCQYQHLGVNYCFHCLCSIVEQM